MPDLLTAVEVRNYRSLADVRVELGPINVFFGPNGGGKSSLLDALWFLRDCCVSDVPTAARRRGQGIGLRFDGAPADALIGVSLAWSDAIYGVSFGTLDGRIDPRPAEMLSAGSLVLLAREAGAKTASIASAAGGDAAVLTLRSPDDLALRTFDHPVASEVDRRLRTLSYLHTRSADLARLKTDGSASTPDRLLIDAGANLWSALRNLIGTRAVDSSFETIVGYVRRAFPDEFRGLVFEPTSAATLYASILCPSGIRRQALGVSDGLLQMLLVLTMLFGNAHGEPAIILLDEPDLSLHPWALAVLAEAIVEATTNWNRQVLIATHSPVLLSQFENEQVFITEKMDGATRFTRLSEHTELADLLDSHALGSLYMAGLVGMQGDPYGLKEQQ